MGEPAEVIWPDDTQLSPAPATVQLTVLSGGNQQLGQLRDGFLRHLERRERSEKTLLSYRAHVDHFMEFVGDRPLSRQLLEEWMDGLVRILKPSSRNVKHSVVRGLLRWAAAQELVAPSLWLVIDSAKVPKRQAKPIPHEDILAIAKYLHDQVELLEHDHQARPLALLRALRTRALFLFIFTTGARISEALSVRRDTFEAGQVLVIQKGGSHKMMLTTPTAEAAIADYLRARTDELPALFLSHQTGRGVGPLTPAGARSIWLLLAGEVGVRSFASHRIRHSTATELGEAEVPDQVIENQMGHTNIATTRGYQKMRTGRRREAVEKALEPLIAAQAGPVVRPLFLKPLRRRRRRRA